MKQIYRIKTDNAQRGRGAGRLPAKPSLSRTGRRRGNEFSVYSEKIDIFARTKSKTWLSKK
jgi:hypothetical protein